MEKQQLVQQLRERSKARFDSRSPMMRGITQQMFDQVVDALSDDQIISSYVTCQGCHKQWLAGHELERAILEATTVEDFLDLSTYHKHEEK